MVSPVVLVGVGSDKGEAPSHTDRAPSHWPRGSEVRRAMSLVVVVAPSHNNESAVVPKDGRTGKSWVRYSVP